MLPTYRPGDWLIVWWGARPRVGDVVLARRADGTQVIKRITGWVDGEWWLEGDNAAESIDSRRVGPFGSDQIQARVLFRYRRVDKEGS